MHGQCLLSRAGGNYQNLVRNNLCASEGLCSCFGLRLFLIRLHLAAEGHDSFIPILRNGDAFESCVRNRLLYVARNERGLGGFLTADQQHPDCQHGQAGKNDFSGFHVCPR